MTENEPKGIEAVLIQLKRPKLAQYTFLPFF